MIIFIALFLFLFLIFLIISLTIEKFTSSHATTHTSPHSLVIVTSHYNEDLTWLSSEKLQNIPVTICSKTRTDTGCNMPNKGREVTSYLKYIIDNYDDLPLHIAFIHGHEDSFHQNLERGLIDVITQCANYTRYGYVSLNNYFIDDRNLQDNSTMQLLSDEWDEWFREWLQRDPPEYLLHDCCAQFIVSKERIRRLPKKAYSHWYKKMMTVPYDVEMGYVFEYIWHIIFGEPDVVDYESYRKTIHNSCFKIDE
jgi:hypothetical protein